MQRGGTNEDMLAELTGNLTRNTNGGPKQETGWDTNQFQGQETVEKRAMKLNVTPSKSKSGNE